MTSHEELQREADNSRTRAKDLGQSLFGIKPDSNVRHRGVDQFVDAIVDTAMLEILSSHAKAQMQKEGRDVQSSD